MTKPLYEMDIVRLTAVVAAIGEDDHENTQCANCNATMLRCAAEEEPTPTCDNCAHGIVMDDLPRLLAIAEAAKAFLGAREHRAHVSGSLVGGIDTWSASIEAVEKTESALSALLPPAFAPPSMTPGEDPRG